MPMVMVAVVVVVRRMAMAMDVPLGRAVLVAVVPQLGLVQQEEEHQPQQQHGEQVVGIGRPLEGLGQQVHEGRGQQRAGRQAQQMLRAHAPAPPQARAQQGRRDPHTADACGQGGQNDCYQCHSCLRLSNLPKRHFFH